MTDPHAGLPVLHYGATVSEARAVVLMAHGRGGEPADMIALAESLDLPDVAFLAPTADGGSWYPLSFLAPIEQNEPRLTAALRVLSSLVDRVGRDGLGNERVAFIGFSQGACLSLEFAARHARRYGGIIGLSGGLIGPPGTPRDYAGVLDGTPVFLGCSDIDPHIPLWRVHESAGVFRTLGATVDERIYPRMGHTINRDELDAVKRLLTTIGR